MFNKTAIRRNKKIKILYKSNPKLRRAYNMKKSLTNLKISFINNNNSFNSSNINIKTSSNSKISPDSSSIRKVQTQVHPVIRKSLFDEKDREKDKDTNESSQKISSKKAKSFHYNVSSSAKTNKYFKHHSRIHLNTEENKMKSKGYYLTGQLPYRDKYIVEIKDNINLNLSKKNENQAIKSKNEFIQCETLNNVLRNKLLNMRKKDLKIDKLAKKLAIKLNLEDKKHNKETKCGCGNLITFKNGFFNGVNLVMSYTPRKYISKTEDNKTININKDNKPESYNLTQQNLINSNGYNFIPTNLPIFLRDKYNIKGTTVLSPFCIEARDEFLFKKIFYENERKKHPNKINVIDNKLNIFYAENALQYDKNLIKFNEKLRKKGKRVIHEVGPTHTEIKLNNIKKKMNFMKKIVDYAYPNMVLARVRESEKFYKMKNSSDINLPPFKKAQILQKQRNNLLGNYLKQSINIQK